MALTQMKFIINERRMWVAEKNSLFNSPMIDQVMQGYTLDAEAAGY